jgi:hypothetical protein
VIWLQTVRVFWLVEGTLSLSCWMCLGLVILGRHRQTLHNNYCLSWVHYF